LRSPALAAAAGLVAGEVLETTRIPEEEGAEPPAAPSRRSPWAPPTESTPEEVDALGSSVPGLISAVPGRPAGDDGDDDGETILPADLPSMVRQTSAGWGAGVAKPGAMPAAGVLELVLSTGPRVDVDRPVLLGRAPEAARFRGDAAPRLVTVPNP